MNTPCIFCDVIAGRLPRTTVLENESVIVIRDTHPQAPVHLLVVPKIHVVDLRDAPPELIGELFRTAQNLIRSMGITKFHVVHNGGGAQEIDHMHVHVMGQKWTSPKAVKS